MSNYWKDRFLDLEKASHRKGFEIYKEIESAFDKAQREIEKEIEAWYGRFAKNNNIDMVEAKKILNAKELKELKWDVNEYIEKGRENSINQKWMKELENASSRFHINRLEALKIRMQQSAELAFGNQLDLVDGLVRRVFTENYYHSIFEIQKGFEVGFKVAEIDDNLLNKIISKPWALDGKNFSERIWESKDKLINELHADLTQNVLLGKPPKDLINNLVKKFNTTKANASRLVMTELAFFHTVSQKEAFKELDADQYTILAVLDSKTSPVCQDFDGKVFDLKDMSIGINAPPFHPNCRSVILPYFDDYGIEERIVSGDDGKSVYYVPADMNYKEWKSKFVDGGKELRNNFDINNWKGLNYNNPYDKKGAINRLKDKYGIEFKDSRKYPMNGELLSDCVAWLDSFDNQYPEFMKNNPCKLPVLCNAPPTKMKNSVGLYRYYRGLPKVEGLYLNAKVHSNVDLFDDYVKKSVENKWYPQNATIHKTFIHEFGHHISNSMRWITNDISWQHKFIGECIQEFRKVEPKYTYESFIHLKDYVSRYAGTSESELFAEAFAEYFGGENPREFAKVFGRKLESLLKEVK